MSNVRGASTIPDAEFLGAYNNATLTNQQVLDLLRTDWTAVGVKLRSTRVQLHTVVARTGGKSNTATPELISPLPLEAQIWQKYGHVQTMPNGVYVSLETRLAAGLITIDGDLVVSGPVTTPAPSAATTPAPSAATTETPDAASTPAYAIATPNATKFAFQADIFGTSYNIAGPTKEDALNVLFIKLQELNFSKVAITDRSNRTIGINEISSGGSYRLVKQLTAA